MDRLWTSERAGWDALCDGTGADSVALTHTATAHRHEGDPFTAAMASTWVRRGERWRLALYQQTPSA